MSDRFFAHRIIRKRTGVADKEITSDAISVVVTKRENALDDAQLTALDEEGKLFLNDLQKDDTIVIEQGEEGNLRETFRGRVVEVRAEMTDEGEKLTAKCYSNGVALQRMRIIGEYGSQSENRYSDTITKILKGVTVDYPSQTRWHRSDEHWINGLKAYKLGTSPSGELKRLYVTEILQGEQATCHFRTEVYKRTRNGIETLLADGAPVEIGIGPDTIVTLSNTLSIPATEMEDTDAIVVKIYGGKQSYPTQLIATFITEVLDANRLPAQNWTVYYRIERFANYIQDNLIYLFFYRFGTSTDDSREVGLQYKVEDPGIINEFVNQVLAEGIPSGYTLKTDYVDDIPNTLTYFEWKYDPLVKALKDMGDLESAIEYPDPGVHWIVKNINGEDQLLLGQIGNHSPTLESVWPSYCPAGTLIVGENIKQYQFTHVDEQHNCVVTTGKFCFPVNERWTEDPVLTRYWEKKHGSGEIFMVCDGGAKVGNYWLMMHCAPSGGVEFGTKYGVIRHLNVNTIGTPDDPPTISFWIKLHDSEYPLGELWDAIGGLFGVSEGVTLKIWTDVANYFYLGLNDLIREKDKWIYLEIPLLGDNEPWGKHGNPTWSDINYISFEFNPGLSGWLQLGIDGLQFNGTRTRMAYNSSKFSKVGCKMKIVTDSLAKEEALTEEDDSGLLAQLTKAELLRGQEEVIHAEIVTELDTRGEAGQLIYVSNPRNPNFGTRLFRILELRHATGISGCFTTYILTSDTRNSYPVRPLDAYNAILKASAPDYQDRDRANLKAREINRSIPIFKKDYAGE